MLLKGIDNDTDEILDGPKLGNGVASTQGSSRVKIL